MYIKEEREGEREKGDLICSAADCHIDLVVQASTAGPKAVRCGMCCLAVGSCQPQRSTGEGGTVAVGSAVIKGSTSRLRGNQSRRHFAPTVLACAHFQQLETCSALASSPSAVVREEAH